MKQTMNIYQLRKDLLILLIFCFVKLFSSFFFLSMCFALCGYSKFREGNFFDKCSSQSPSDTATYSFLKRLLCFIHAALLIRASLAKC